MSSPGEGCRGEHCRDEASQIKQVGTDFEELELRFNMEALKCFKEENDNIQIFVFKKITLDSMFGMDLGRVFICLFVCLVWLWNKES